MIYLSSIDIFFKGELYLALVSGVISFVVLYIARRLQFFKLPVFPGKKINLNVGSVIKALIIYIVMSQFMTYIIFFLLQHFIPARVLRNSAVFILSWINFSLLFLTAIILYRYLRIIEKRNQIDLGLRLDKVGRSAFYFGVISWIVATPVVLFFSQVLDIFTYIAMQVKKIPEQLAVTYIKKTMQDPQTFFLAIISVGIFAPFIEELIFRGFFQTWLKKNLGLKASILIASFAFAFFHFSTMQGAGNIPIIGALFLLSCFLGFIYEKKKSLIAPMTLHSLFNLMSVFNLFLIRNSIT